MPSAVATESGDEYLIFHKKGTAVHGGFVKVKPEQHLTATAEKEWAPRITMNVEEVTKALEEVTRAGGEIVL